MSGNKNSNNSSHTCGRYNSSEEIQRTIFEGESCLIKELKKYLYLLKLITFRNENIGNVWTRANRTNSHRPFIEDGSNKDNDDGALCLEEMEMTKGKCKITTRQEPLYGTSTGHTFQENENLNVLDKSAELYAALEQCDSPEPPISPFLHCKSNFYRKLNDHSDKDDEDGALCLQEMKKIKRKCKIKNSEEPIRGYTFQIQENLNVLDKSADLHAALEQCDSPEPPISPFLHCKSNFYRKLNDYSDKDDEDGALCLQEMKKIKSKCKIIHGYSTGYYDVFEKNAESRAGRDQYDYYTCGRSNGSYKEIKRTRYGGEARFIQELTNYMEALKSRGNKNENLGNASGTTNKTNSYRKLTTGSDKDDEDGALCLKEMETIKRKYKINKDKDGRSIDYKFKFDEPFDVLEKIADLYIAREQCDSPKPPISTFLYPNNSKEMSERSDRVSCLPEEKKIQRNDNSKKCEKALYGRSRTYTSKVKDNYQLLGKVAEMYTVRKKYDSP